MRRRSPPWRVRLNRQLGITGRQTRKTMTSEEFNELENKLEGWETDAMRWRWLVRHASLSFDGAPSWNAVIRLPVFDSADQTITSLVDSARKAVGDA